MQPVKPRRSLRVLVVGVGRAAALSLAALHWRGDATAVAAVDPAPANSAVLPAEVPLFPSLAELPPSLDVDVAVVSTPTPIHVEVCRDLIERRTAPLVLCEKPLSTDAAAAAKVLAEATAAGVELRVLFHYAHASEVLWACERLHDLTGSHGAISGFTATFVDPYAHELPARVEALVSSWFDSGINALSVAARLVLLRRVLEPDVDPEEPSAGAAAIAFGGGGSGGTGRIETSWRGRSEVKRTSFAFEDGTMLVLDHTTQTAERTDGSGRRTTLFRGEGDDARQARYRNLFDAHLRQDGTTYGHRVTTLLHTLLSDAAQAAETG
jgi:predicted dehydrogenase